MFTLLKDVSFALRQLAKHRVYALTAIVSMALGIGATAAVYSVLYGVLIDPYPYRDADRIAFLTIENKQGRGGDIPLTLMEVDQLRQAKSVEDILAQNDAGMVATDGDIPQSVKVLEMTGNGLQFLAAPPLLGRIFTAAEAPRGVAPPPIAVISYPFWKSHFASSPDVLGKILELNRLPGRSTASRTVCIATRGDYPEMVRVLMAVGAEIPRPDKPLEATEEVLDIIREYTP